MSFAVPQSPDPTSAEHQVAFSDGATCSTSLRFHAAQVRFSESLVLTTIQYCVPAVTETPAFFWRSTTQQSPNVGRLDRSQLWMAAPGAPLLSALILNTRPLTP